MATTAGGGDCQHPRVQRQTPSSGKPWWECSECGVELGDVAAVEGERERLREALTEARLEQEQLVEQWEWMRDAVMMARGFLKAVEHVYDHSGAMDHYRRTVQTLDAALTPPWPPLSGREAPCPHK